jgi:hypothetical protein
MTSSNTINRTEQFLVFCLRNLIALLVVTALLGATVVGLTLSPPGAVRNPENLVWWLSPIGLAIALVLPISIMSRRFDPGSPEVSIVTNDEWRQQVMNRAARTALVTVLIVQWPLGLLIGFMTRVSPPRAAMAMAAATITIGLTTFITTFLFADREPTDA